jgi:hypothetical protein
MADRLSTPARLSLTAEHRARVESLLGDLQGEATWHGELPVLLLDRCWLRLSTLAVRDLLLRLPPDGSGEAPELVRYRELLGRGWPPWLALQHCWDEFGATACREALLRFWNAQDHAPRSWTMTDYLALMADYRWRFVHQRPRSLPLILLARRPVRTDQDGQQLVWLSPQPIPGDGSMRHTCA